MRVPLLDLKAHHAPLEAELLEALRRVALSGSYILGPENAALEAEASKVCGTRHAVGLSSGTDALLVALMALGVGPGDEVATSAYSFFATAGAVARLGAKPVFVDIDPVTFNLDPGRLGKALTRRTKAVIPVHLYGQSADLKPVLAAAKKRRVPVIEDAAQAIGALYEGRPAGSLGDAGCLSFFPTKNLGAMGDAGMAVTNDPKLAERLRILRVHGAHPKYFHRLVGGNFRLDELQAAVLRVKLKRLPEWTAARRRNAARYDALFALRGLPDRAGLVLPRAERDHTYNQYVIRAPRRDALREFLAKQEVSTEVYYPVPLHLQECFKGLGHRRGDFPEAEKAASQTLALPVYPELSEEQQAHVVESIARFYAS